jgi:5-methylcytosine-specific restriction endonuclease McrA
MDDGERQSYPALSLKREAKLLYSHPTKHNNMIKLVKKSSSGSTKEVDLILSDVSTCKSLASSILLRKYLMEMDADHLEKMDLINKRIEFSRSYLESVLSRDGDIKCAYCGKGDLAIEYDGMRVKESKKATIDHIVPVSRGGGRFDASNITPCCGECNGKKGDKPLDEFFRTMKK